MHLGSEYQVRVAAWLAVEMLAGRQGLPFSPGGTVQLLRGETQESVDDLLVGTVDAKYGFIQAKRKVTFSDKRTSEFASVIDQAVRQITMKAPGNSKRPWSRDLAPETDRLLLVTGSESSKKITVVLRSVLIRARDLASGQPLSDAAVTEEEQTVLDTTASLVRHFWKSAIGKDATNQEVHSVLALLSVEMLDVEEGQHSEREAKRTLGSTIIVEADQEGAAWAAVLKACRRMIGNRSGLELDSLRQQLQADGIVFKNIAVSQKEVERHQKQSDQIDKLIDEARNGIKEYDYPRCKLLLERIERDHGSQLNAMQRFRVVTNHGFAALGLGKTGEAAKRFLEALKLQPEDERARVNEVLAFYIVGDRETALSKAEQIRALYPSSPELAYYWVLASPFSKASAEIEKELSSILLEEHKVRVALAEHAFMGRDFDTAERHAEKACLLDPAHAQAKVVLGRACMARIGEIETGGSTQALPRATLLTNAEKHTREAIRLAEIEKDKRTQVEALVLLVNILLVVGKFREASDEADRSVKLAPENSQAHMARAEAQFANGLSGEGVASLQRAYAIEPREDVAFMYGRALFARSRDNDLELAVEVLKGIDLSNVFPIARHAFALQTLQALMKAQSWIEAKRYLDNVGSLLGPENLSVLRGLLAHYEKAPEEAENHAIAAQSGINENTHFDVRVQLGQLFMLVNRPADALPLFEAAFEAGITQFDADMLLNCAAGQRRDDVVISTFRTLLKRGVKDWNTVSFGVQYLQKWVPAEAANILNDFIAANPTHRLAKLQRSVLGVMLNRSDLVNAAAADLPLIAEVPDDHIMQIIHVLRYAGNPKGAVEYAYQFLRLHFKEAQAHRALLVSMSPFDPMAAIPSTLEEVELGAAVRYDELPAGDSDWIMIEETGEPLPELKETGPLSQLAKELLGKKIGDQFVLAPGFIPRQGIIRQIVPKYVRSYNDCGDKWQIRFPEEPMLQSVHLGNKEEDVQESLDRVLQTLEKQAATEEEMRKMYNTVSTPLHVFGNWRRINAYQALLNLASSEDQPVRTSFGTDEERKGALEALKSSTTLVVDMSALATLRLLALEKVLTTGRFKFQITENSWRELRETLREEKTDGPSLSVGFQDGRRVAFEETVEFKLQRAAANKVFLELVKQYCEVTAVEEVAALPPTRRDQFEQIFGQYGSETMLLAARPDAVLWSDDLIQSHVSTTEFGTRRVWTQLLLAFLTEQNLISARERDAATAKLVGMQYHSTFFDALSFVEAVHLADAKPWEQPLKTFIKELAVPSADLRLLFPILEESLLRIYREPLLPENRCRVMTALLDAMWTNSLARRSLINLRARSARMFLLNPVGEAQFNACFDSWLKRVENPIVLSDAAL